MNEHDLSLQTDELTDDERKFLEGMRQQGVRVVKRNEIEPLFNALIAARAENKRLRDGLLVIANADFGKVLELTGTPFVSSGDKYKSAEDFQTAGDHSTDARYIRPAREQAIRAAALALLQSEKERCGVKKKLVAKLEELLRQGYETVTIHQVLEWIHAFSPLPREKGGE